MLIKFAVATFRFGPRNKQDWECIQEQRYGEVGTTHQATELQHSHACRM